MYALVGIIILILVILILVFLYTQFKSKIEFYITGLDSKFSISDLNLLWNVAKYCELENPNSLFWLQRIQMRDKDVVYVANAPTTELQKFLQFVFSPITSSFYNIERMGH